MIRIRKDIDRGRADFGWLKAKHSFSFGHYYDPANMGFASLRVINEDRIAPGTGFDTHGHEDMEIVTYVIDGALEHKDSMENGSVIRRGDVQRMTAGTGVRHSEFNHSAESPLHLLQIWILPEARGLTPGYEERNFSDDEKRNQLRLIASRDGRSESITIHQDVDLYASLLGEGSALTHVFAPGRKGWVQIVDGEVDLAGQTLSAGDGAAIEDQETTEINAGRDSEFLLFDMR